MSDQDKTKRQLIAENEALRQRIAVLEGIGAEHKRAAEALRESEERYRLLAEAIPHPVWRSDAEGRQIDCNRRWQEYTGQTPEEAQGAGWMKALHPDDVSWAVQRVREDVPGGKIYQAEYRLRRASDDSYHWHLARAIPRRDGDGTILGWFGCATDIDEQKRAEEELAKSKAILLATIECLPFEFFAIGLDGRYMLQNAVSRAQHQADTIGKLPEEVCPNKDDLALWLDNNRRAFAGEKVEGEVSLALAGEKRFYHHIIVPIRAEQGLHGILGVNIDITERKRAEEALQKAHDELERRVAERTAELTRANERLKREVEERQRAEEALRQSERRFRNYFEQGLIGMAVTSVDKRWLEVNERLCEILGYCREELTQKYWAEMTHPDDLERNLELFNKLLAGEVQHFTYDKRYLKKDGGVVYTTIQTRVFRRDDGTIDHVVVLVEDITARTLAEEALERERQSLWRMLQASDYERRLISYDIHDGLAQYLAAAAMQFQSHAALNTSAPDEARKAYETAVELVRQAHFEARRLISEVRPPVIDEDGLETAMAHLVHEQRRRAGSKIEYYSNVRFGRLPSILENALYRIAQEAMTNACKHSRSANIAVTMTQEGQYVCLEVRDWGIGFDSGAVEKGHFGLEGIRQRVRLLGGRLTIDSARGSGTRLQVVVPIVERQSGE